MRFIRALKTLLGLLAVVFIGVTVTLFIGLPRVVNQLADIFGTGTEATVHWLPLIPLWIVLVLIAYLWVWRPWRQFTYAQKAQGLVVQRGQGRAFMDTESVRQQVYAAVVKIPNVQRVEITINNDLGRAAVQMNILTDKDINGPKKKQEISREVKKVVQDQLGVLLASEPTINLSLMPMGGDIPHAIMPESATVPTTTTPAPRMMTAELPRRAVVEPTPLPRSEPIRPINRVVPEPMVTPPVVLEPPLRTVESTSTVSETSTSDAPVTGSRPFSRRAFTPPAGSVTLPDLPKIEDRPNLPMEKLPEDTIAAAPDVTPTTNDRSAEPVDNAKNEHAELS